MVDRLGLERKPPLAGKQRSGGVGFGRRLAESRTSRRRRGRSGRSSGRTPARRDRRPRDRSPVADGLDDSGRLVAERHRRRARPRAVDHRQVRMAEARRRDLNLDFAAAGGAKVELDDFERLRLGVGRREARLGEERRLGCAWGSGLGTGNARCWARSAGGATGKLTRARTRPCAANAPAPHTFKPASPYAGAAAELKPCRRPTAAFSTISRVS